MRAVAPFGFRSQYLAGGVNTGNGWATWNANGDFVTFYVRDSLANGVTPVFDHYQLRQSLPGGPDDGTANANNLANVSTMRAFFDDLRLFMQRAGAFAPQRVILHFEPDLWGFAQQWSAGDDARSVPAKVASTGASELAGLPDTIAGLAQAALRLRDRYAPNVLVAYHVSVWGTGNDILYSDPSDATVDALASRTAAFYRSLDANFDIAFTDTSDRDAGFKQLQYGDGGASWWSDADYARHARFLGGFASGADERIVLWQTPLGNRRMRAQNNTWGHYQDDKVEWFLDDASRAHLAAYVNAGAVALIFGGGAAGTTCACDGVADGVTDPGPINGNTRLSLSADDDGGYFKERAAAYYAAGAIPLAAAAAPSPPPGGSTCTARVDPGIPPPAAVPAGILGFHAQWYGQSGYPALCPGGRATATVAYYNSGARGWVAGRMGEVAYLGTWGPEPGQDRASPLGGDGGAGSPNTGWPRYDRVAIQPAPYVGPGQVAWFQFTIAAPAAPGRYRLYLRPLIEGATWMEDFGVFWLVTVLNPDGTTPP